MGALLESSCKGARARGWARGATCCLKKDPTPEQRGTRSTRTTVDSTAKAELPERDSVISQTVLQETKEQHSNFFFF